MSTEFFASPNNEQPDARAGQAEPRADHLALANKINNAISSLQTFETILHLVFEQIRSTIHFDVFFIALYDEKTRIISFPILHDGGQFWEEPPRSIKKTSSVARAIESGLPTLWNRTPEEIETARDSLNRIGDERHVAASIIVVPLQAGDRAIGALSIQSYQSQAYTREQLTLLSTLAPQITVAIENARLFEEANTRARHLALLNEIGREISALRDLPTLLETVFEQMRKVLPTDLFFVGLYDAQKNEMSFPLMYDDGQRWEQNPSPVTETTFSGRALLTRQPLLVNHWADPEQQADSPVILVGDRARTTVSLMFAPMLVGQARIGVISVQSYQENAYSEEDLSLLSGIANQVAVSIQNTRLLEETKRNAGYLATLNELGRVVSELRDLPDLLEVIYEQIRTHLSVEAFFVELYDPESHRVSHPITYDNGVRYHPKPDELKPDSFLHEFLNGAPASLILRTEQELQRPVNQFEMFGDKTRLSASLMAAPIKVGEQVIGAISAQSYALNAYTREDLGLLVRIGNQIGVAIHNARLLEEVRQNAQQLLILNEVGRAVSKIMDLPDLLEVIYEQSRKSLALDAFFVGLYHPVVDEISFPIVYDSGTRYEKTQGPISEHSFMKRLMRGEKPILLNRTADELALGVKEQETVGRKKISASIMAVPLVSRDQVIGMVSAQSYTMNAFDQSDLKLLEGIANQVAIAIENSHLYAAAQQELAERQRIAEQLRAAEAKYRELIEHSPAVIYSAETGTDGRWFYVSPQIESLLGFTPEEWMADPHLWHRLLHPEDRELVITTEAKTIAEGSKVEIEYRIFTRDGQVRWIRDESLNVSISDTQHYIVQGILTDITARKQAELDLKQSEEKFHSLFLKADRQARELSLLGEVQRALAGELDLSELMKTVVEAIAKTFGYTFVSLYLLEEGDLVLQHQVGYQRENAIAKIPAGQGISAQVLRTGQSVLVQDVSKSPEFLRGDPRIRSEISVPLFNSGEIFGTLNVESAAEPPLNDEDLRLLTTLSEQVNIAISKARLYAERAENLRREQTINEFAHAITSTFDLSAILEKVAKLTAQLVSSDTATVTIISADGMSMENIYNYNEDPVLKFFLPRGQGLIWQVYETGVPVVTDEYSELPNALPEWIASGLHAYMCFPLSVGGKTLGTLSLYNRNPERKFSQRDYSLIEAVAQEVAIAVQNARLFEALQKELEERKRVEREREAMYQDLEAKNAELEKFTYTVSHDLKSPLVTIAGFLGFLEEDIRKGDEARVRLALRRIHEAAVKMHRLLDELLELSRIGRLANPSVEVPLGELAHEAFELAEGELAARQVEVRIEAGLPSVFVDRIRMVEVLQNLIVNAAKFMGGQRQPFIEIGMEMRDGEKVFFVRDNGMGIATEYHHKVFGLFEKLDPHGEGTGIGLALVKRIIEVHGGKIWVESERGKGATFLFTLKDKNQQENL